MRRLLTLIILLSAVCCYGQDKPKQHVYYDTIKQVKERVDYSPDTIPVYFKELVFTRGAFNGQFHEAEIEERWNTGFVVWQTYRKNLTCTLGGTISSGTFTSHPYYKDDYTASKLADGVFLYTDKRPVKNKVIFSIKR